MIDDENSTNSEKIKAAFDSYKPSIHETLLIRFQFAEYCNLRAVTQHDVETYEEFFRFFVENHQQGIIFDVQEFPF